MRARPKATTQPTAPRQADGGHDAPPAAATNGATSASALARTHGFPAGPPDPAAIAQRGELLRWLSLEQHRHERYGRPYSIVELRPDLPTGARLPGPVAAAAAAAVRAAVRITDVVGWFDETTLVVIMPETEGPAARDAALRLEAAVQQRTEGLAGPSWTCAIRSFQKSLA